MGRERGKEGERDEEIKTERVGVGVGLEGDGKEERVFDHIVISGPDKKYFTHFTK